MKRRVESTAVKLPENLKASSKMAELPGFDFPQVLTLEDVRKLVTYLEGLPKDRGMQLVSSLLVLDLFPVWSGDIEESSSHVRLYSKALSAYTAVYLLEERRLEYLVAVNAALFAGGETEWWPDKLKLLEGRVPCSVKS